MSNPPIVTMRSVAKAAGVAPSTVSKALRSDPTIPAATCAEIQKLAERLGYRPNPLVSALMAQLHKQRRRTDPHHLAWIDLWPGEVDDALLNIWEPLLGGARRRADELGYRIEVHRVGVSHISPERLKDILTARAQWGVIIPPVPESAMRFPLDLRGLTGVTIGTSLHEPVMHRVSANHFQGAQLACERLRARGYTRIGIVLSPALNERVEHKWLGAYLANQQLWPETHRVPPLIVPPSGREDFRRWLKAHKPNVLLIGEPHVSEWARQRGEPAVPVVWLGLEPGRKNIRGIDYPPDRLGAAAIDLVVGQIHRNERGSPAIPHTLLMDGVWVEN